MSPRLRKATSSTIRDVAKAAGVSVATVSRYLNGSEHILPETATRVGGVMEAMGYVPRTAARNLSFSRTMVIGLISEHIGGEFFVPLLDGIEEAAYESGYGLLVSTSRRWLESAAPAATAAPCAPSSSAFPASPGLAPIGPHNCDGLIVFPHSAPPAWIDRWAGTLFPVVLMQQESPPGLDIPVVGIENRESTREGVLHLIRAHGRRRIAFLEGPAGHDDGTARYEGYRDALRDAGLPFAAELVLRGEFDDEVAEASVLRALDGGVLMDAVFAGDDTAAVGALRAFRSRLVDVPGQVSLMGFDGQPMGRRCLPPIATIEAPSVDVGRCAVRTLLGLIEGREVPARTVLPTRPLYRGSCGCQ